MHLKYNGARPPTLRRAALSRITAAPALRSRGNGSRAGCAAVAGAAPAHCEYHVRHKVKGLLPTLYLEIRRSQPPKRPGGGSCYYNQDNELGHAMSQGSRRHIEAAAKPSAGGGGVGVSVGGACDFPGGKSMANFKGVIHAAARDSSVALCAGLVPLLGA
eukprot:6207623-Pleurochrysis_carterae.AAC.3